MSSDRARPGAEDALQDVASRALKEAGYKQVNWERKPLRSSRNTLLLRGVVDGRAAVAKQSRNSFGKAGQEEVRNYRWLNQRLRETGHSAVTPEVLASDAEYGVVVLEWFDGKRVDELIVECIERSSADAAAILGDLGVELGELLTWYHRCWGPRADGKVRLHGDFSPKNLLSEAADGRLVVLDPPGEVELDAPSEDLARALFEFLRLMAGSRQWRRMGWWQDLRRGFLEGYYGQALDAETLHVIHRRERRYLWVVMGRYVRFWTYGDWLWQAVRGGISVAVLLGIRGVMQPYVHWAENRWLRTRLGRKQPEGTWS